MVRSKQRNMISKKNVPNSVCYHLQPLLYSFTPLDRDSRRVKFTASLLEIFNTTCVVLGTTTTSTT